MKTAAVPRWAISFADLVLLLLGGFVFLHAIEAARPAGAAGVPSAEDRAALIAAWRPADLFERGEARLTDPARARLAALASGIGAGRVLVASHGLAEGGARLDRFELAAARSVAVARALREAGLDERRIAVRFDESARPRGQRIELLRR
jgi:flagellar motor protein MotB